MLYAFFLLPLIFANQTASVNICYLSLNNDKEFSVTKTHMDSLNRKAGTDIQVIEFQDAQSKPHPEESFKKMVESGTRCDGLVISGHHYGKFGGKQAQGQLGIDFIEKLSCDPKYKDWFDNVKSLWLQGCRTMGAGPAEAIVSQQDISADFHTSRVGRVRDLDHLDVSYLELNMEFSGTLDQDNPLSSRYLRVFPKATVFGWTKSAPGEASGSEYSLPFHMAHMAALNEEKPAVFKSPTTMTNEEAIRYSTAVLGLFKPDKGDACEFRAIDAWINHGNVKNNRTAPGFNNPDIQAFPALVSQDSPKLKLAKQLACNLETAKTEEEILSTIEAILADKDLMAYNFNNIWETIQRLEKEGSPTLPNVRKKLQSSDLLTSFVISKLGNPDLGITRKIDYYAFLRDLNDTANLEIEAKIIDAASGLIRKKAESYDERDFQITIIQSLSKNGLLNSPKGKRFLSATAKSTDAILRTALAMNAPYSEEHGLETLQQLKGDKEVRVRAEVAASAVSIGERAAGLIEEMLTDKNTNVRWAMAEKLPAIKDAKISKRLMSVLKKDSDVSVREVVVDAAAAMRDVDTLIELSNDENPLVKARAQAAIRNDQPASPFNFLRNRSD